MTMIINCFQIELTNICNYNCIKCPRTPELLTRPKGFMDIKLIEKILKLARKYNSFINFSFFGEPLLHKDFFTILDMSKDIHTIINSNMSLATKETFKHFIDLNLNQLRISIDAVTEKTYSLVRPSNSIKDLDGNIITKNKLSIINQKVKYWHLLNKQTSTRHVYPVSSLNFHEVNSYVNKWKFMLALKDEILIKSIISYGGKIKDLMISNSPCNIWNLRIVTISWNGDITLCNLDTNLSLKIGNINEQPLEDILNNNYQKIKKLSLSKNIYPCTTCIDSNNWSKNIKITKNSDWNINQFKSIYGKNND